MSLISTNSSTIDLPNNLEDIIILAIKELPEWALELPEGEKEFKCFGVLNIEKHFDDGMGREDEMMLCSHPDCSNRSHCCHI